MEDFIYLVPPNLKDTCLDTFEQVLQSNWITPGGPMVEKFEGLLSKRLSANYVLALNSGTSALHLALVILGVKANEVVFCPSFTFVASVNPVSYIGAEPVFVGVENETWNLCPKQLLLAIEGEKTKGKILRGVILVHGFGVPAKIKEIQRICVAHNLFVLEDAAPALGSVYHTKSCGTFGDMGVFSFNGNKIITTSGGGLLITSNQNQLEQATCLAHQAKVVGNDDYVHSAIGYNYRMSNVLASLGVGQLQQLETFLEKKKSVHEYYQQHLSTKVVVFDGALTDTLPNYWLTNVLFESLEVKQRVKKVLKDQCIEVRDLWKPLHVQPIYKHTSSYSDGYDVWLHQRGLSLPSGTSLATTQLQRIVDLINQTV